MGLRKPGILTKDVGRKEKNRGSASIEASIAVIFLVLISLFGYYFHQQTVCYHSLKGKKGNTLHFAMNVVTLNKKKI